MNMRLIDADALLMKKFITDDIDSYDTIPVDEIVDTPTIDAVEVVRCKDCKHRGIVRECPMCYTEDSYDEDYGYDYWDVDKTVDDGFCHCGEMDVEVKG